MRKQYFIVTCHGWSASNWLAHALNLHKDITCTHSARNVLANAKDLQSNKNLRKNIQQLHTGYFMRQNRGIESCYDEIEDLGNTLTYGSVHVYRLRDLPVASQSFEQLERTFKVINMVRNPISLVWSGYGQFKDLFLYDINELYWTLKKVIEHSKDFIHQVGNKYNVQIGELDNLAFIGACSVLSSLRLDIDAIDAVEKIDHLNFGGTIKMEEVTTSKNYFKKIVSELSENKLEVDDDYLSEVFETGIINKHKIDTKEISPQDRFESWPEWRKEIFLYFMNRFKLIDGYQKFGYNLKFLV